MSPEREQACAKVTDMARTVLEYMNHLEHAPAIQAMGLSEPYQALAEFNGTVLAGRLTSSGVKFVTWDWDFNHTGLNHGHMLPLVSTRWTTTTASRRQNLCRSRR